MLVVSFGRRPESNPEVIHKLSNLPPSAKDQCAYRQVDVCNLPALKLALSDINAQFGGVKNIVHTAAVVNDATIVTTNAAGFENVLRPIDSWNLHVASQELNLGLESSVLAALQKYKHSRWKHWSNRLCLRQFLHGFSCHSASLQLGAWESKLTDNIDMTKSFAFLMKHDEGIPLIMKAMMVPIPLQVIARMDSEKLSATPAYAKDPFFASLLPTACSKQRLSGEEASKIIVDTLRVALELQTNERLDTAEPLTLRS